MIVTQKFEELIRELGDITHEDSLVVTRNEIPHDDYPDSYFPYRDLSFATGVQDRILGRFAKHTNIEYPGYSKVQIGEAILNAIQFGRGNILVRVLKSEKGLACIVSDEGGGFDVERTIRDQLCTHWGGGIISYENLGGKVAFNDSGNSVIIQYLLLPNPSPAAK